MDIPRAAHSLAPELAARGLDPERILWTDADIIFAGDWASFPPSEPLPTFAAGTEVCVRSPPPTTAGMHVPCAEPAPRTHASTRRTPYPDTATLA